VAILNQLARSVGINCTFNDNVFETVFRSVGTLGGGFGREVRRMVNEESGRLIMLAKRWTSGNVSLESGSHAIVRCVVRFRRLGNFPQMRLHVINYLTMRAMGVAH